MKNTKFKVGDWVVRNSSSMFLKKGVPYKITGIRYSNDYDSLYGIYVEGGTTDYNPDNFELHKESKVLEILRTYDKIRSSKGQGTTQVDS